MLRRIVVVLAMASVAVGGATALLAAPTGASVPTANLCNSLKNLHYTPSSDPSTAGGQSNAKKLAKAFNKIAKQAKGDLKAALKTMAQYFSDAAKLDTTALQNDSQAFASAVTKFSNYLVQSCTAGLPGGVTIPTIPSH